MFNAKQRLVAIALCPSIILDTWPILIGGSPKIESWLILETTLCQQSIATGLHLKSELLAPFVPGYVCLLDFGPFQRSPLCLFP